MVGRKRGNPDKDDYESWTDAEDCTLREAVARRGTRAWAAISTDELSGRSRHACRNRWRRLAGRRLAEGWLDGPLDKRAKEKRAKAEALAAEAAGKKQTMGKVGTAAAAAAKLPAVQRVAPPSTKTRRGSGTLLSALASAPPLDAADALPRDGSAGGDDAPSDESVVDSERCGLYVEAAAMEAGGEAAPLGVGGEACVPSMVA